MPGPPSLSRRRCCPRGRRGVTISGNVYLFCAEVRAASAGATIGFSGMLPGAEPGNANMHEPSLQPAELCARQGGNRGTWRARCFLHSRSYTRGGSVRGLEEIDKRFADIRDPTDFCVDFDHLSVVSARDLDRGLVALHLANAIKRLDLVADLDKPLNNLHLCPVCYTCRGADTHTDRRARTHNRDTSLSAQTWAAAKPNCAGHCSRKLTGDALADIRKIEGNDLVAFRSPRRAHCARSFPPCTCCPPN
jgi:hypothetical protein